MEHKDYESAITLYKHNTRCWEQNKKYTQQHNKQNLDASQSRESQNDAAKNRITLKKSSFLKN